METKQKEKNEKIISDLSKEITDIEKFISDIFLFNRKTLRNGKNKFEFIVKETVSSIDRLNIESYFNDILNYLSDKYSFVSKSQSGWTSEFNILYKEPTLSIKYSHRAMLSEKKTKFFYDSSKNNFKVSLNKFSCCSLENLCLRNVQSFSFQETLSPEEINQKKLALISKARFDDKTWSNLNSIDAMKSIEGKKLVNITSKFNRLDLRLLKEAFIEKKSLHIRNNGLSEKCRDYSIETKMCDDGVFRAWYSSEYHGCLNGDYYLLLNPTQAIFSETD